ncbi:MAG: hypothetical protein WA474_06645 [Candidatus Sulfotelmatobacter sp.]
MVLGVARWEILQYLMMYLSMKISTPGLQWLLAISRAINASDWASAALAQSLASRISLSL